MISKSNISGKYTSMVLALALTLSGCMTVKPAAVKSGKKLFETFFVGEEGTQYFIKPLLFENKETRSKLNIDFTFRYKDEVKDSTIINLSIFSAQLIKKVDNVLFKNNNTKVSCEKVKFLFNETENDLFEHRMTMKIALSELKDLFGNSAWEIDIGANNTTRTYSGNKKTVKALQKINDNVFILMN